MRNLLPSTALDPRHLQEIYLEIPEPVFELIVISVQDTFEAKVWNEELIKQCIEVALAILPFF